MYHDTITVFNRYHSRLGDMYYPTILHNVNVNKDKARIASVYGELSQDTVVLNVRLEDGSIEGKRYMGPKEWARQLTDDLGEYITFAPQDFFMEGEYPNTQPIPDDDYLDGFYNAVNAEYDNVFLITSVSEFSVIPHLEITGK